MRLPVIVGFGGVGPAGRSSFHHAYRRTVVESISGERRTDMFMSLASMMQLAYRENGTVVDAHGNHFALDELERRLGQRCLDGTLIRRLETNLFDPDRVASNSVLRVGADPSAAGSFTVLAKDLPEPLPLGCTVEHCDNGMARIIVSADAELKLESRRKLAVQSAGQLPTGFDPAALYKSRFHPRGLQLTIIAASDAVKSVGIDWETIKQAVSPDEICVYAASAMGQLDEFGTGGMTQARLRGGRVSSKQLPLGLNQMPADFVNAYILGNVGATGAAVGACATFLYNLRIAVDEIKAGRRRVAIVGNAEAPLLPEVIEGYAAMSALATDENLCKLDATDVPDYRRASRPFANNCGFVLAESGQYVVLFDDALAMELGSSVYGAVSDVFVNADGIKKSISAPGPGNYITLGKAVAAMRAMFGERAVRERSFIQAHGSSTPQNRTTESRIFDEVAAAFGISDWPVTAVKAFIGHSLAPASADQMINTLGIFNDEILPGIKTADRFADDIFADRLNLSTSDIDLHGRADIAFLNSKGFGGNNATGAVISPRLVHQMLTKRYGAAKFRDYQANNLTVCQRADDYDDQCMRGPMQPIYQFGDGMIDDDDVAVDGAEIRLRGFDRAVDLALENPYEDMV